MWSPVITLNMSILVSLLRTVSGFCWEVVDTSHKPVSEFFLVQIAIRVVKTAVPVKRVFSPVDMVFYVELMIVPLCGMW